MAKATQDQKRRGDGRETNPAQLTEDLRTYLHREGADLVGFGAVNRLDGAPEEMRPQRYLSSSKCLIAIGIRVNKAVCDLIARHARNDTDPPSYHSYQLYTLVMINRELDRLVRYWKGIEAGTGTPTSFYRAEELTQQPLWEEMRVKEKEASQKDDLLEEAIAMVRKHNRASISLLQRRLRIGYSRAARLIDMLEEQGIRLLPVSALITERNKRRERLWQASLSPLPRGVKSSKQ